MVIIAGLGNPGRQYENTRHNTGFCVIDVIAERNHISVSERKHKALIGKGYIEGHRVILAKPQTWMNLSGESIRELTDYYKADEKNELIVIYDDVSMDTGQMRIRTKGRAGGHNGIRSIISHLGHDTFLRIKIGVGKKPENFDLADYVLGHFKPEEQEIMKKSFADAGEAVRLLVCGQTDAAMNQYNKKVRSRESESTDTAL